MLTVEEVLHAVLPRLPGPALCSIFEAVREVQGIIANRLLLRRSYLLKKSVEAELEYAAGDTINTLPSDFQALDGRPWLSGGSELTPLAGRGTSDLRTPGTPKYYEQAGRSLRIYPPSETAATVNVAYFFRPPVLTNLDDRLPFDGRFDDVFIEGAVAVMSAGLAAVADKTLVAVIQSQVDAELLADVLLSEQQVADAINDGR